VTTPETDFEVAARIAHVEPLVGLDKKIQPAHTDLLVIDMQNDFVASDGLVGRSGRDVSAAQKLANRLPDFIAAARRAGVLVIFIRNIYSTERNFYLSDSWLEQAARKQSRLTAAAWNFTAPGERRIGAVFVTLYSIVTKELGRHDA
jgi:hypothetical protein